MKRPKPDENLMSLLVAIECHADTLGADINETAWRVLADDIPRAQEERSKLLLRAQGFDKLWSAVGTYLEACSEGLPRVALDNKYQKMYETWMAVAPRTVMPRDTREGRYGSLDS